MKEAIHPKEIPTVTLDPRHFKQTLPENLKRAITDLGLTGATKQIWVQAYYFGVVATLQETFDPTYATVPDQIDPEWYQIAFNTLADRALQISPNNPVPA